MIHTPKLVFVFCAAGAITLSVYASYSRADVPKSTKKSEKLHPTLVQIKDTPGLPRVLLIGDSVSMWYTPPVRKLLEGKANVHRPPVNCHHSRQVLGELDSSSATSRGTSFTSTAAATTSPIE
jgi:hypothetical protein